MTGVVSLVVMVSSKSVTSRRGGPEADTARPLRVGEVDEIPTGRRSARQQAEAGCQRTGQGERGGVGGSVSHLG